jgi:transposase-like protein
VSNTRNQYPEQFKRDAVALAKSSEQSIAQIARELGINHNTLYNWINKAQVDAGEKEGLTSNERSELTKLRRENRRLQMERDILKKAAAWFARESENL